MTTPAFATFVAPARARAEVWRLAVGFVVVLAIWALWVLLVLGAVLLTSGMQSLEDWMGRMALAETPTSVLLVLATFVGCALGSIVAARVMHKRSWRSLFGPAPRVFRGFLLAGVAAFVVFALAEFIWPSGYTPVANTPLGLWINFAPLAVLGVFVQTGAEELLFRGYLQQQLAARFRSPFAWMVFPSILFGALHYNPLAGAELSFYVIGAATVFGLVAADLTRVTGSIGAAWGIHFANNCFAILFVSLNGALSGLSLYTTPFSASDIEILRPLILRDVAFTLAIWVLVRAAYAYRARKRDTAP